MKHAVKAELSQRAVRSRGYSLVEVALCVVIVGGLFAAAMHTLGASRLGERQTIEHARAHALAQGLMDEILSRSYAPSDGDTTSTGGENGGMREYYNYVGDYDGWVSHPPRKRDGTVIGGFDDWTRRVDVAWVDPSNPEQVLDDDSGLKRITVTVQRGEAILARTVALRSRATDKARPSGAIAP